MTIFSKFFSIKKTTKIFSAFLGLLRATRQMDREAHAPKG